jgi:hypothetical protein
MVVQIAVMVTVSVGALALTVTLPELVTGALVGSEDVQVTFGRGAVVLLTRLPVAVSVTLLPGMTVVNPPIVVAPLAATVIVCRGEASTVAVALPLIVPEVAVTVAIPAVAPVGTVSNPFVEPIEAGTGVVAELTVHVTLLRVLVLPSSLTPVAVICSPVVSPTASVGEAGPTMIEVRTPALKNPWQPTIDTRANKSAE